jgi:hypothetical protein
MRYPASTDCMAIHNGPLQLICEIPNKGICNFVSCVVYEECNLLIITNIAITDQTVLILHAKILTSCKLWTVKDY